VSLLLCRSLRVSAVAADAGKDSDGALEDPLFGMRPGAPPLRVGASAQVRAGNTSVSRRAHTSGNSAEAARQFADVGLVPLLMLPHRRTASWLWLCWRGGLLKAKQCDVEHCGVSPCGGCH
jgi:hypothetical protein